MPGRIEQPTVAVQKIHEQKRATPFVAIGKGVIFDHKVQQVGGFGLHARVGRLPEHTLVEVAEQRFEGLFPFLSKER